MKGTDMDESLQYLFVKSRGAPVTIGDRVVVQVCKIPITRGIVHIRLLSPPDADQGICVDAREAGSVELSNGSFTKRLYVWHEPALPNSVSYSVICPKNELLVWNIYRVHHKTGEATEDYWTGNAGMVLLDESPTHRRYACSDWRSPFDPTAIEFEVGWNTGF